MGRAVHGPSRFRARPRPIAGQVEVPAPWMREAGPARFGRSTGFRAAAPSFSALEWAFAETALRCAVSRRRIGPYLQGPRRRSVTWAYPPHAQAITGTAIRMRAFRAAFPFAHFNHSHAEGPNSARFCDNAGTAKQNKLNNLTYNYLCDTPRCSAPIAVSDCLTLNLEGIPLRFKNKILTN